MIVLDENSTTEVYVTLGWKYIPDPLDDNFLFVIEDDWNKTTKNMTLKDQSVNILATSIFNITHTSTKANESLANGIIYLKTNKRYKVEIYYKNEHIATEWLIVKRQQRQKNKR